jgi:hypothetical protein
MTKMKKRKPKTLITPRHRRILPSLPSPEFPRFLRAAVLVSLFLLGLALPSPAADRAAAEEHPEESSYALIFGTVWGPADLPLYGVKIRMRRADQKKPHWELYSDHHGEFAQRVPAGTADYLIWADLKGYKAPGGIKLQAGPEVKVHVENNERVDTGLHLK